MKAAQLLEKRFVKFWGLNLASHKPTQFPRAGQTGLCYPAETLLLVPATSIVDGCWMCVCVCAKSPGMMAFPCSFFPRLPFAIFANAMPWRSSLISMLPCTKCRKVFFTCTWSFSKMHWLELQKSNPWKERFSNAISHVTKKAFSHSSCQLAFCTLVKRCRFFFRSVKVAGFTSDKVTGCKLRFQSKAGAMNLKTSAFQS